eukprot:gene5950-9128_t
MTKCERFPVPAGSFGSAHPGYLKRCNASSSRLSETCLSEEVIERTWSVLYLDEGFDAEVESLETSERNKSVGNISFSSEQQCIPDGGMRQRSSSEGLLVPRIPSARAGIASPRVATACTTMHHMSNPDEAKHVEAADGEIVNMMGVLRIEGCTVLTRCLGFQKLDGILRREPDVFETELTADSDFAIVASDGLWDVVSADDAFALMQQLRAEIKDDPSFCDLDAKETAVLAAEALVDEAELRGSADD